MTIRVIQWGTGNVGLHGLRQIINHPELELVGLLVNSPAKVGKDAGEICGLPPTGVKATNDPEALFKIKADCVSVMGFDPDIANPMIPGSHNDILVNYMCRFLEAGYDVVSTSSIPLVWPTALWDPVVTRIEAACEKGDSSYHCTGVQPGLVQDILPLTLSGACERIDKIHCQTIFCWEKYSSPSLRAGGFGLTPAEFERTFPTGTLRGDSNRWIRVTGPAIRMTAAGLGVKLDDDVVGSVRYCVTDKDFTIPAGKIAAGTIGAIHFELAGLVNGVKRFIIDRIIRLNNDLAPDWPQFKSVGGGGYRIIIEGLPSLTTEVDFGVGGADPTVMACLSTATMATNAIPVLHAAPSGYLRALDLPRVMARGLMTPSAAA